MHLTPSASRSRTPGPHPDRKAADLLSTVARTGKVLNLFSPATPEWGVREAAGALGVPKSNAHELMASMSQIGLLQRTPSGRYRLGWRLLSISYDMLSGSGFESLAQRVVTELATHVGETVTVGAWDGLHVVCVASAPATTEVPALAPGATMPGHATALGKLLLSHLPRERTLAIVDRYGLPRITRHTVPHLTHLESQLDSARRNRVAFEYEEFTPGFACVATGIHDRGDVIAAISVCAPAERMRARREEFAAAVRGAARRLSRTA